MTAQLLHNITSYRGQWVNPYDISMGQYLNDNTGLLLVHEQGLAIFCVLIMFVAFLLGYYWGFKRGRSGPAAAGRDRAGPGQAGRDPEGERIRADPGRDRIRSDRGGLQRER